MTVVARPHARPLSRGPRTPRLPLAAPAPGPSTGPCDFLPDVARHRRHTTYGRGSREPPHRAGRSPRVVDDVADDQRGLLEPFERRPNPLGGDVALEDVVDELALL